MAQEKRVKEQKIKGVSISPLKDILCIKEWAEWLCTTPTFHNGYCIFLVTVKTIWSVTGRSRLSMPTVTMNNEVYGFEDK